MSLIPSAKLVLLFVAAAGLTGCASYRSSSNIETAPAAAAVAGPILIVEDALPGRRYTEIGPVEVSIKKLTVFHKDPTREQANDALADKARSIGANAVIKVTYTTGVGLTTWGYIDAKGIGVKVTD